MEKTTEDEASEKKFLLPGGQRFYFKVKDLVSTINKYKDLSDNDSKSVTIEYGVHSVDSLSGSTGQGRGVNGMYFAENRLTKLNDISQSLDGMQSTGLICFDTFALGQGYSGAKDNVPHDIYNAGFKITIGKTKLICLKSFVVKDKDENYSLQLYYVGDDENDGWEKNASDLEFAFPIYWDKDEKNRKISQDDLLKAKVNLQIIDNKNLDEISEAKIKESQAITEYSQTDNEGNKLFLFAESGKYYKEENVSDGNKIGQNSKIKRVGKISLPVLIPVLVFLLMFFVIKVAIPYAIIYAVLSIVVELIVYSIFFHKNREEDDKDNLKEIKLGAKSEREESIRDKIEKSEEYRKDIEALPWKYGTAKFDDYASQANNYNGPHIMIFRFKQNENESNKIVCLQYCIYSLKSENQLGESRVYDEEFPNPESIICLNYGEQLHLKVSNTLTFCDEQGNEMNKEILTKLNATINLNDASFKDQMDNEAKNKIVNTLIKDKEKI